MTDDPTSATTATSTGIEHVRGTLPGGLVLGLALAVMVVLATAFVSWRSLDERATTADRITKTLDTIGQLRDLLSNFKDAETGQRGYLLTKREGFLEPYQASQALVPRGIASLRVLLADSPKQLEQLDAIEGLRDELADSQRTTFELMRDGKADTPDMLLQFDRGKALMDRARGVIDSMQGAEYAKLADQQRSWADAVEQSFVVAIGGATVLILLIVLAGFLLARGHRERATAAWVRAGQSGLGARLIGERRLDTIGDRVMTYLARYLDAAVGTLYVVDRDGNLRRASGFADGVDAGRQERAIVPPGMGLVGQVARDGQPLLVRDVPPGYMTVTSGGGRHQACEVIVVPASTDDALQAVLELGFFRRIRTIDRDLLALVANQIAVAVRAAVDRERVEALLARTQQQAAELQAQQEELRVSNEELEEQGRALKASQAQLENQQAELEQTNSQLEEQTQLLEDQKDSLMRVQNVLSEKADELARTNQYKSEFLANMSHELRTPLNSTLILAKLLAENKDGNLTGEQVRFAETITAAGNDLLLLINDILDLSKIEAGKVEIRAEPSDVKRLVDGLVKSFEPMARDKGLHFTATMAASAPTVVETDVSRVAQILRNLLSNAIKFTDVGEVSLSVDASGPDAISFVVGDSGIGIPIEQQDLIFDAFRQADGSTHRRYGGTGLGLSISRNLARVLGGDVVVDSAPGRGSRFTLTMPLTYVEPDEPAPAPPTRPAASPPDASTAPIVAKRSPSPPPSGAKPARPVRLASPPPAADDRARLSPLERNVLVIEDDVRFAEILRDLVHEQGFQCVVTHNASDGLDAAARHAPSAILLDVNLPDHSGLGVLDRLKRDPRTRHIPVHVASVADYSREARELGAIGYDVKPVDRKRIVEALKALQDRFSQRVRRVLVVEDDARQLSSLRELLSSDDVEIVGVARADEALEQLRTTTFDCMVMDLNLPDVSGYELLERMSASDDVSFPPVIVYTGRVLSHDEEQRLSRHSRSIIIKDARSPERLLDEVTLFLHQVESELPADRQRMLREARRREAVLEGRRVLIVEDDVRNVFALSSVLEPKGATIEIARNGVEALRKLDASAASPASRIDLVLMDIMMPEMDGYTAMREIRKDSRWKKLPIIALTAKAMRDDQEKCLAAGATDYIAKPLDIEKLMSLIRVWMPKP